MYGSLGQGGSGANLLGPLASLTEIQNRQNQNQLFQQTFRARAAMGPIIQKHIDPKTGVPDWYGAATEMAINPDTSFMASDFMNQLQNRKLIEADIMQKHMEIADKKFQAFASASNALANSPDKLDRGKLVGAYAGLLPDYASPEEIVSHLSKLGDINDDASIRAHARQFAIGSLRGSDMLNMNQLQDTRDPYTGAPTKTWFNKQTLAAQAIGGGAGGQPGPTTLGTAQAAMAQGGAPGAPGAPAPAPAQPAAAAPAPGPTSFGPTPNREAEIEHMGKTYYPQLQKAADQATTFKQYIGEAKMLLKNFDTNRASELRTDMARWGRSVGLPEDTTNKIAGGDVSNAQALQKLMIYTGTRGMAVANEGNAAVRSVQEWNKFMEANPNLTNDPKAITKMYDFMSFLADLTKSEQKQYNTYKSTPGADVTAWPAKWNDIATEMGNRYWSVPGRR